MDKIGDFYTVNNHPSYYYVILQRKDVDYFRREIGDLYYFIKRIKGDDYYEKKLAVINYFELSPYEDYWKRSEYDRIGSDKVYVGKTIEAIDALYQIIDNMKINFDKDESLKYGIYEYHQTYYYIIYQYDNPIKWDIHKIHDNDDATIDDQFYLANAGIKFKVDNKTISITDIDKTTFATISSISRIAFYAETGLTPFKRMDYGNLGGGIYIRTYQRPVPKYQAAPSIDYLKMVISHPELTKKYLERHLITLPSITSLIINEISFRDFLYDLIILYINTYPDSKDTELMYYYLALVEEARPSEDKINQLTYLLMAKNIDEAKRHRNRLFAGLIGLPFGEELPFDLNLDAETLVNLGRYLINRR